MGRPDRTAGYQRSLSMGAVTAWAHLRTCYRYGACTLEDLQRYVAGSKWQRALPAAGPSRCSERSLEQWSAYSKVYDAGGIIPDHTTKKKKKKKKKKTGTAESTTILHFLAG